MLLAGLICKGQDIDSITFKLVDSLNAQPIFHGAYFLHHSTDTLLKGTFVNGHLILARKDITQVGSVLRFKAANYNDYVYLPKDRDTVSSQVIMFKSRGTLIDEVVVDAKKPLITSDIDKIAYHVQLDPDSKFLSVLYMLQKLPFVSLGADESPLLKGSSNFLVLLDNRKSSLFAPNNLREALKTIPAANVLRIEVMTDPPARYESEGYAGIINIVTTKRLDDGYNGSVNLNASNFYSGGSSSINFRRGKFGMTFFGGLNYERTARNSVDSKIASAAVNRDQKGNYQTHGAPINSNILLSYEIDSLNLLTANFGLSSNKTKTITEADVVSAMMEQQIDRYSFQLNEENTARNWDANISYQRNFKNNKNKMLSFLYRYYNTKNEAAIANNSTGSLTSYAASYRQDVVDRQKENAIQIDYVHPLKKVTIETGALYTYRDLQSNFATTAGDGLTIDELEKKTRY